MHSIKVETELLTHDMHQSLPSANYSLNKKHSSGKILNRNGI